MLIGMTVWGWIQACSVLGKSCIGFMCTFLMWCSFLSHDSGSPALEKTNNHGECGKSEAGEAQAALGKGLKGSLTLVGGPRTKQGKAGATRSRSNEL